jgi:hypothetical protein
LLARQLFQTALSRIEPIFDPLNIPSDLTLRANSWFLPWIRDNLLVFYDHEQLSTEVCIRLLRQPLKRLLQVYANHQLGADWAVIEKLDDRFLAQASLVAESLLNSLLDFIEAGTELVPIYVLLAGALNNLRTDNPWLAPRRKPALSSSSSPSASSFQLAPAIASSTDGPSDSSTAAPAASQQPIYLVSSATKRRGRRSAR